LNAVQPIFKRVLASILVVVTLSAGVLAVRYERRKTEEKKREASYQSTLTTYTQALKPGITRKEVEDYLRKKNLSWGQICCVDSTETSSRHSMDYLVLIGREDPPWFCSENNVYVAFEFDDRGVHGPHWDNNDADELKTIKVWHHLDGCL
jgi:hypothetical protein